MLAELNFTHCVPGLSNGPAGCEDRDIDRVGGLVCRFRFVVPLTRPGWVWSILIVRFTPCTHCPHDLVSFITPSVKQTDRSVLGVGLTICFLSITSPLHHLPHPSSPQDLWPQGTEQSLASSNLYHVFADPVSSISSLHQLNPLECSSPRSSSLIRSWTGDPPDLEYN